MSLLEGDSTLGKRQREPDEEGYQTQTKTSRITTAQYSKTEIPLTNRYSPLGENSQSHNTPRAKASETQTKTNTKFFPPITTYIQIQTDTITQITRLLKHDYLLEYIPNGLKIRTSHIDDFNTIKTYLATNGHEHFDYGYETPKFARFVVRGLPVNIESTELIAGFAAKEIILQQHRQLKKTIYDDETNSRKTIKLPLWVIAIEKKKDTIYKLKSIVGIHHIKIKIEDYRGRSEIQQCYKCQKFGHKAYYCNMKEKCLRCAGEHNTRVCTMPQHEPTKCANCDGNHAANSKDCPIAKKYQEAIQKRRSPTQIPTRTEDFPRLQTRTWNSNIKPQQVQPQNGDGLAEIINLFTSGTLSSYVKKIKLIINSISQQTDTFTKIYTFCTGLMDLFENSTDE